MIDQLNAATTAIRASIVEHPAFDLDQTRAINIVFTTLPTAGGSLFEIVAWVRLTSAPRKKSDRIYGDGDTLDQAVADFKRRLEFWKEALK